MIIASDDDKECIEQLMSWLVEKYPTVKFELLLGKISKIDANLNQHDEITKEIKTLCYGYVIGWMNSLNSMLDSI